MNENKSTDICNINETFSKIGQKKQQFETNGCFLSLFIVFHIVFIESNGVSDSFQ